MAYRTPRFYFRHEYRNAGAASFGGSAFAAASPSSRLIDSAITPLAAFNATTANQFIYADRGVSFAALPQPDRLIIPAGHNFAGTTVEVRTRLTAPGVGTDGTLCFTGTVAAGLQVLTITTPVSNRYISFNVPASGTAWAWSELWCAVLRTTTRGPADDWTDALVPNQTRQQLDGGQTYRLSRGVSRRQFVFTYNLLSGTDLQVFLDLRSETQNGLFPFYLDPPDTGEPAILVELMEPIVFKQDSGWAGSSAGPTYTTRLSVIEAIA